jgi:molecular chaperone DnaK (HSP70)
VYFDRKRSSTLTRFRGTCYRAANWKFIQRALESCENALADAHMQPGDIREVLMVGGQTRMPAVRAAVRGFFGIEPNVSVDPDEVVALGAGRSGRSLGQGTIEVQQSFGYHLTLVEGIL